MDASLKIIQMDGCKSKDHECKPKDHTDIWMQANDRECKPKDHTNKWMPV